MVRVLLLSELLLSTIAPQAVGAELERYTVERPDATHVDYYLTGRRAHGSQPILLVIQGSDCNSIARHPNISKFSAAAPDYATLYIEKYGITDSLPWVADENRADCPEPYLRYNTEDQRVLDTLRVIAELRRSAWWNGELVILAGSSGSIVGEQLAVLVPETKRLVILGFGSRRFWTDVESSVLASSQGGSADAAQQVAQAKAMFQRMGEEPTSSKHVSGHSYAYWAAMTRYDQLAALSQIAIPVLAIQGANDKNVSVEGARALIADLDAMGRRNITYREYPGLDHGLRDSDGESHMDDVISNIRVWLQTSPQLH